MLSSLKSTKFQVFIKCKNIDNKEVFRKIGHPNLNDGEIGFCLKADDIGEASKRVSGDGSEISWSAIYPTARNSARSVSVIKIVIEDTKLRRAPVLRKLEVWGVPSFRCSQEEIIEINRLLKDPEISSDDPIITIDRELPEADDSFNIPENFLDAITHDLLVMPYILPSGSVIDESTIRKYNKHEELYGRLPSDPFTSLVYTSNSQPKFDESLKSRLDEFKLHNSHEIEVKNSGRTVGKRNQATASTSTSTDITGHVSKKIKLYTDSSTDLNTLISSIYKNNQISVFTRPKQTNGDDHRSCSKCKAVNLSGMYQITTCSHKLCKPCLLQLNLACKICGSPFESKDIVKLNL